MKFLADMGISPKTVMFLRHSGQEAVHLHELKLDTLADNEILEKARRENTILLTSDLDFGELMAAGGYDLPSVIIFRLINMRPENVNRHLSTIIKQHENLLNTGVLMSVTENQVRVRKLPINK